MILCDTRMAPLPGGSVDGMITTPEGSKPGAILTLWKQLREHVRVLKAKAKQGVRFKVRSADELVDKLRDKCNELGILIYPAEAQGKGHVVEEGTLAEQTLLVV